MMLRGKTAIISGSSSGMGLAIALRFAANGCQVVINGRNVDTLQNAKIRCLEAGLQEQDILTVVGDIGLEQTRKSLVNETIEKFGKLDILVNCAGFIDKTRLPYSISCDGTSNVELMKSILNVDLFAVTNLCEESIPHLIKTKGLGIHGVRCNTIRPGYIFTPGYVDFGYSEEDANKEYGSGIALGKIGQPDDIAATALFLASNDAKYITGAEINVDGGCSLMGMVELQTT